MLITKLILGFFFAVFFIGWISALRRQLGFRKGQTNFVYAQLTDEKVEKNVNKSQFGEWNHKRTSATYSYMVNGVWYHHTCTVYDRAKAMPSSTKLIYQRKRPKEAYLPEFEPAGEKGFCVFLFVGMLMFGLMELAAIFLY